MQTHNPSSPPPRSFISKYPAALVANIEDDQVEIGGIADGAFNDRTLLAALGDTVRISLPASLGRKAISMDLQIPIKWKTKLFPVIVQYANGTNWVDSVPMAKVTADLDKAKRLYATLGLNLEWDSVRKIHDADLLVSLPNGEIRDYTGRAGGRYASPTEAKLLTALSSNTHGWNPKNEVAVVYVKEFPQNNNAHAIPKSAGGILDAAGNAVMMSDQPAHKLTVLGHELEHIFLQAIHGGIGLGHPGPYPNEFNRPLYLWSHQEPQLQTDVQPVDGFKKSFRISKRRAENLAEDIVGPNRKEKDIVRLPNSN